MSPPHRRLAVDSASSKKLLDLASVRAHFVVALRQKLRHGVERVVVVDVDVVRLVIVGAGGEKTTSLRKLSSFSHEEQAVDAIAVESNHVFKSSAFDETLQRFSVAPEKKFGRNVRRYLRVAVFVLGEARCGSDEMRGDGRGFDVQRRGVGERAGEVGGAEVFEFAGVGDEDVGLEVRAPGNGDVCVVHRHHHFV